MSSKSKNLIALIAGAFAGLALGMLLAPEKGSETRKKVKKFAEDLVDDIKEKSESAINEMNGKVNDIKNV
jgi:gas vesicle protein